MEDFDDLATHLLALETALHKREVRSSAERAGELLADDFVEFGSSGRRFNKAEILKALASEVGDVNVTVEEFRVRNLAPTVVLVTYLALTDTRAHRGRTRRSSIWRLADGRWQMVFHQGTRAAP